WLPGSYPAPPSHLGCCLGPPGRSAPKGISRPEWCRAADAGPRRTGPSSDPPPADMRCLYDPRRRVLWPGTRGISGSVTPSAGHTPGRGAWSHHTGCTPGPATHARTRTSGHHLLRDYITTGFTGVPSQWYQPVPPQSLDTYGYAYTCA